MHEHEHERQYEFMRTCWGFLVRPFWAAEIAIRLADKYMIIILEHSQPCILPPLEKVATILVNLRPFQMFGRYERLIVVRAAEGNYIVACLPLFTYGILFGDLVEVEGRGREFNRVLRHSGMRTLRFRFKDPKRAYEVHGELQGKLAAAGLPHEWYGIGYLAVLLRNVTDQERALTCLGGLAEEGIGRWEVDPEPFA